MHSKGYDYTIPSDNRELQQELSKKSLFTYYTIPSDNRELQHGAETEFTFSNYTIPSDNRELQPQFYQLKMK